MRKLILFIFPIPLLLSSCEDRWQEVIEANTPPDITFIIANEITNLVKEQEKEQLKDSLKLNIKSASKSYRFDFKVEDDHNSYDIDYEVPNDDIITTEIKEDGTFQGIYWPTQLGENVVKIKAVDDLGAMASIELNLFTFDNLAPVSHFTYQKIGNIRPGHYEIDASSSYDADQKFGGNINRYEFTINKVIIPSKEPVVEFIFQEAGQYEIILRVQDNEGQWGEALREIVMIEF